MSRAVAPIVGGVVGALALLGVVILVTWFFLCNHNRSLPRTSETGSSDPSQGNIYISSLSCVSYWFWWMMLWYLVGRPQGVELVIRETRRFEFEELSLATNNFSDKSLIGEGKFGMVYKGLLHDGMLVAIKRRPAPPSLTQDFIQEVLLY